MTKHSEQSEQGIVSLLTVMFFMIFISMLVVGFIGLVGNDQRQTIDRDLSASALAAAKSGVEEGKRVLLYCRANPTDANCDNTVLNSVDNCNVFRSGPGAALATQLKIPINTTTGQGVTGGANDYQQYYSCLTIQRDTPSVSTVVNDGYGYIQQLRSTADFNTLVMTWTGKSGAYADRNLLTPTWPQYDQWKNPTGISYAPAMQLQIVPYSPATLGAGGGLDVIEHDSKTLYVIPCGAASCLAVSHDINLLDNRNPAGSTRSSAVMPITSAPCTTLGSGYSCSVALSGFSGGPTRTQYYVRASVMYAASTNVTLALRNGVTPVTFNDVQPWIDVTGRTNDVFRRVRAQVSYSIAPAVPQNALDTAAPICKDMIVTADAATSRFQCD